MEKMKNIDLKTFITVIFLFISIFYIQGQNKLYSNSFFLGDVQLLDGPFKKAQDLNINTLLKYDINRLLAPYQKAAGLPTQAENYGNWENTGLDGHIAGHYLSAMAMNYAATGDIRCKIRMESMISELKKCQDANSNDSNFVGYLGGGPNAKVLWLKIKNGNPSAIWDGWAPWYNIHKMYAGLRDAWLYGGNETAKDMFLKSCDWGINLCANLSDSQMETMLANEFGGMNEVYADAYQISRNIKYLNMAKRFSHKVILNSFAAKTDNLDNKHANTQIPKAIGFERIAEESNDSAYVTASKFFWESVTQNRTLAFGGNSRKEFFPQASASMDYITDREGPESCNTYNMLKLTEGLFRMDPEARYADYYERALFNHILSTQHPEHGGYVYFTPARPEHYRVYSAPNEAMWCCVGTGMENHGKYGQFIYTHRDDTLFVNLFIASKLNWKQKGITVIQQTLFPDEESTKLTIHTTSPKYFKLMVRHPAWVSSKSFKIMVGKKTWKVSSSPSSYVPIARTWKDGDVVKIILPMENRLEELPNVPQYVAVMHGPILLAAKTGTQDMKGLIADDSRWGHIANGPLISLDKDPVMIGERSTLLSRIYPVKNKPLTFITKGLFASDSDSRLVLEPFFRIHDSRYMMYWMALTRSQYQKVKDSLTIVEKEKIILDKRTIDAVAPGQQQPEADHMMKFLKSETGFFQNESWRKAIDGGYFSYVMRTGYESNLSLMVRYRGDEKGARQFDILVDGEKLVTENITVKQNRNGLFNIEYQIIDSMIAGKKSVEVRFQPTSENSTAEVFNVRILRKILSN
jgi:uncharacterized protein